MSDTPKTRVCADCGRPFDISADEQQFFRARAAADGAPWVLPARCLPCRRERRRELQRVPFDTPIHNYDLTCVDCGRAFTFRGEDVKFYRDQGHCWPKRCPACRAARRSSTPRPPASAVSTRSVRA